MATANIDYESEEYAPAIDAFLSSSPENETVRPFVQTSVSARRRSSEDDGIPFDPSCCSFPACYRERLSTFRNQRTGLLFCSAVHRDQFGRRRRDALAAFRSWQVTDLPSVLAAESARADEATAQAAYAAEEVAWLRRQLDEARAAQANPGPQAPPGLPPLAGGQALGLAAEPAAVVPGPTASPAASVAPASVLVESVPSVVRSDSGTELGASGEGGKPGKGGKPGAARRRPGDPRRPARAGWESPASLARSGRAADPASVYVYRFPGGTIKVGIEGTARRRSRVHEADGATLVWRQEATRAEALAAERSTLDAFAHARAPLPGAHVGRSEFLTADVLPEVLAHLAALFPAAR